MEKEALFEKRMKELSKNAYYRGVLTFSDFLDLNELHMLHSLPKNESGVHVETFGGYALAERQMAAFIPDALFFQQSYPISCICIRPTAEKFAESLTHRDYLGAILNLGIERSKIGDILVDGKTAYVFCHENMAPFLMQELCRIRSHSNAVPRLLNTLEELPSLKNRKGHRHWRLCDDGQRHRAGLFHLPKQHHFSDRRGEGICERKRQSPVQRI